MFYFLKDTIHARSGNVGVKFKRTGQRAVADKLGVKLVLN